MSEYILKIEQTGIGDDGVILLTPKLGDQIVRCRDCKLFDDTEPAGCTMFDFATPNQSNGFCAWGERK